MAVRFTAGTQDLRRTASLPSPTGFTVACWLKLASDRNEYQTAFSLDNGSSYVILQTYADGTSLLGTSTGGSNGFVDVMTVGSWYFAALVGSGGGANGLTAYSAAVGATTLTSAALQGSSFTPTSMFLGSVPSFGTQYYWAGDIAAVKVWDAVLTAAELAQERWFYTPRRLANLHLWSPCVESTVAGCATDYSGNARAWTVTSTPSIVSGPPIAWRPTARRHWAAAGGTPPPSFKAAWARGSNVLIGRVA
jgi:hypothetical protein